METSRRLRSQPFLISKIVLVLSFAGATGCAAHSRAFVAAKHTEGPSAAVASEGEIFGPATPAEFSDYGPQPVSGHKPLLIVLGPGMARGLAQAGVLAAIREEGIPIAGIVGTEIGGLVAALFALTESSNKLEWALLQFKNEVFYEPQGLFSSLKSPLSDGDRLSEALKQAFGTRHLNEGSVKIGVMSGYANSSAATLLDREVATVALRGALANFGIMTPERQGRDEMTAATTTRPYALSEARLLSDAPIVLVDVLNDPDAPYKVGDTTRETLSRLYAESRMIGKKEFDGAAIVIRPELANIDYMNFQKRTEIIYRGKRAAKKVMARLRELAGLPPKASRGAISP